MKKTVKKPESLISVLEERGNLISQIKEQIALIEAQIKPIIEAINLAETEVSRYTMYSSPCLYARNKGNEKSCFLTLRIELRSGYTEMHITESKDKEPTLSGSYNNFTHYMRAVSNNEMKQISKKLRELIKEGYFCNDIESYIIKCVNGSDYEPTTT